MIKDIMTREELIQLHITAQLPNIEGVKRLNAACEIYTMGEDARLTQEERDQVIKEVFRLKQMDDPYAEPDDPFSEVLGSIFGGHGL